MAKIWQLLEYLLCLPAASLFCFSQYVFTIIFRSVLFLFALHCHSAAPHRWRHEGSIQSLFGHCNTTATLRWRHEGSIQYLFGHCHTAATLRWRHEGSQLSTFPRLQTFSWEQLPRDINNYFSRSFTSKIFQNTCLQQQLRGIPTEVKPYLTYLLHGAESFLRSQLVLS